VGAVFKLYLRELPEPITTFDVYSIIVSAVDIEDLEQKFLFFTKILSKIPDGNKIVLKKILLLFRRYAEFAEANRMDEKNLAVVFAPAIFRAKSANAKSMMDASKYVEILQFFIENVDQLL
jgi:hypothetical protein